MPETITTSTGQVLQGSDEIKGYYSSFADYLTDQGILDLGNITPSDIETYFQHVYTNKESDGNRRHRLDIMISNELNDRSSIDIGYSFDYIDVVGLAVTDAGTGLGASYDIHLDSTKKRDVYESKKHGLFGQFQHTLVEDKMWLNLGVRYDHHDHYGGTFNPRIGLVWQPEEHNTVKLLYGEAFREPNIFELSSDSGLKPAELKSYELGIAHSFGQIARISLSGYYSQIDNFLGSVGSLIGTGVGDVETQTVEGMECQFDIKKGPVTAFINGAYIFDAKQEVLDSETGSFSTVDLLGLPGKKVNIGVSYFFLRYYTLSLISSHIGAYQALSGNSSVSEPIKIKAYHDIKLTLGVTGVNFSGMMWDGFITINNLTDRKNYEANIRRSGPHVFEQKGRTFMIGIGAAF
jgi:outer membrane receptor protein involved in Fe transport